MDPFKLNFITASSFQQSKGFHLSPKVNEPNAQATMTKFGNLAWSTTLLISEMSMVTPNIFFAFLS